MCIFHKWTKWGKIVDTDEPWYKLQVKECTVCGMVKRRRLRLPTGFTNTTHVSAATLIESLQEK